MTIPLRVAVYGSGAVGGYFGGRLAQAGIDVTFVACRSKVFKQIHHRGQISQILDSLGLPNDWGGNAAYLEGPGD